MNIGISLCLPAFNEEQNIKKAVNDSIKVLTSISDDWEIVIVDDGSKDKTALIANELVKEDKRIRLIQHSENRGYGAALKTAFYSADKEWVWLSASDNQFDPSEINKLTSFVNDSDIIAGYRIKRQDPMYRRLYAYMYSSFIGLILGLQVRDLNCGFKLIRQKVFKDIKLTSEGALIDAELFLKSKEANFCIKEVGVEHKPREFGEQTGGNLLVVIRMFIEVFKLRFGKRS